MPRFNSFIHSMLLQKNYHIGRDSSYFTLQKICSFKIHNFEKYGRSHIGSESLVNIEEGGLQMHTDYCIRLLLAIFLVRYLVLVELNHVIGSSPVRSKQKDGKNIRDHLSLRNMVSYIHYNKIKIEIENVNLTAATVINRNNKLRWCEIINLRSSI